VNDLPERVADAYNNAVQQQQEWDAFHAKLQKNGGVPQQQEEGTKSESKGCGVITKSLVEKYFQS
jgi:hypothetical protein